MTNTNNDTARTLMVATDGACLSNPGPGGWSVVAIEQDGEAIVSRTALAGRADGRTTNNQMELQAAIEALRFAKALSCTEVTIISDSRYVTQGATEYLPNWKTNGWRTSARKPVKNKEQWQTLDTLADGLQVRWEWTAGHAGHQLNELADMIATDAAQGVHDGDPEQLRRLYPEVFQ